MIFQSLDYFKSFPDVPKNELINGRKFVNGIISEAKRRAKLDTCYYCNTSKSSFCNSHNVPAFCLRNISKDGELYYSNTLIKVPVLDDKVGINSAGTFQLICRDCDSKLFQKYENPDNYKSIPDNIMLAQIALKNYLKLISKKNIENEIHKIMLEKDKELLYYVYDKQLALHLDLKNYTTGYSKAKKIIDKNKSDGYYLIYYDLLDYVAPLAFQGALTLASDFDGKLINDIYNYNENYLCHELQLAVFPLKTQTAIIMFVDEGDKRYRSFYKSFRKLSKDEKLRVISYIIFLYSEDYFFSKELFNKVSIDQIQQTAAQTPVALSHNGENITAQMLESFALKKYKDFPNILSYQ